LLPHRLVVFTLTDWRYGLPLHAVDRIVRIAEVNPLPKAPDIVLGVVNVQGLIIPVINLRRRFRLPEREIAATDQLIVAHTARRPVALVADAVTGVIEYSDRDVAAARDVLPEIEYAEGVVKLDDGLVLIHDLDKFLLLDEEAALVEALRSD